MSSAEFDTRRRGLGLSLQETADYLKVPVRRVKYRGGPTAVVPPEHIAALKDLRVRLEKIVVERLIVVRRQKPPRVVLHRLIGQDKLDSFEQTRGVPPGAYAMMTAWTLEALERRGIPVLLEWN